MSEGLANASSVPEVDLPGDGEASMALPKPAGKGRMLTIVRRKPRSSDYAKHKYLVARKPRDGEPFIESPPRNQEGKEEMLPFLKRGPDGHVLERSILGSVEEMIDVSRRAT
jgi:hypothetical protein